MMNSLLRTAARGQARAFSAVPKAMKAAVVRQVGAPDVMKIEMDYPVPAITDGQVRAPPARVARAAPLRARRAAEIQPSPAWPHPRPRPHYRASPPPTRRLGALTHPGLTRAPSPAHARLDRPRASGPRQEPVRRHQLHRHVPPLRHVQARAAVHRRPGGRRRDRGALAQGGGGGVEGGRPRGLHDPADLLRVLRRARRQAAQGAGRRGARRGDRVRRPGPHRALPHARRARAPDPAG